MRGLWARKRHLRAVFFACCMVLAAFGWFVAYHLGDADRMFVCCSRLLLVVCLLLPSRLSKRPRSLLRTPSRCEQLVEQLVEVPAPSSRDCVIAQTLSEVVLARYWAADGCEWSHCSGARGLYWWKSGTRHTQWSTPEGVTASPGRKINTVRLWPADIPVVQQRRVRTLQTEQKPVIPQCSSWLRLLTRPSLCSDRCWGWSRQCRKRLDVVDVPGICSDVGVPAVQLEVPQTSSSTRS